jgi:hypothetical protein
MWSQIGTKISGFTCERMLLLLYEGYIIDIARFIIDFPTYIIDIARFIIDFPYYIINFYTLLFSSNFSIQ